MDTLQTIESHTLLSRSKLWTMLRDLYANEALDAWHAIGTPFYLTSTPLLANLWAETSFNFFRELYEKGSDGDSAWTVLEMGAGSGRFAYLFITRFEELHRRYFATKEVPARPWRYLLLDVSRPLFEFWQTHPYLESYWHNGNLDCGYFDISCPEAIFLEKSGTYLLEGSLTSPCIAIGGYLFDTLPAEAYIRTPRGISPLNWTLQAPSSALAQGMPAVVKSMQYDWHVGRGDHALADEPHIEALWVQYEQLLSEGQSFTVPSGALLCIDRLRRICPKGILLLSADQGYGDLVELSQMRRIELGRHGSFSCPVNYDALARLLRAGGSAAILSKWPSHRFMHMGAFWGEAKAAEQTQAWLQDQLNLFDNENYWRFFDQVIDLPAKEPKHQEMGHQMALPIPAQTLYFLLKIGHWDPVNFFHLLPSLKAQLPALDLTQKVRWLQALEKVSILFYPIVDGDIDLLHQLATLATQLGSWPLAASIWHRASSLRPKRADLYFNLGLAYYHMGQQELATHYLVLAQNLDPSYSLETRGLI